MKPTLRSLSSDLIATVLAFRSASMDERPSYRVFRQEMMDMLDRFERCADQERVDPNGDARFALVALVDETVMSSDWEGATDWAASPLQMHYFGDFNAGTRVFERIDEVQRHAEDDLIELYYTVMCAGFRGQYNDDPTALMSIRNKLYRRLPVPQLRDEGHLTPEAYGRELERPLLTRRFPFFWLLPFAFGAVGLYLAYYIILERQAVTVERLASQPIVTAGVVR